MKDVYNFLDYIHNTINDYFLFFYGKRIRDFKNANIEYEEEYMAFRGDGISANGKEGELGEIFNVQNSMSQISSDDCICEIERLMLSTDSTGRTAIVRRVIKKIGEISYIRIYGIDEMIIFAHTDKKPQYIIVAESAAVEYLRFIHCFHQLCDDFSMKIGSIAEEQGFSALVDLVGVEYFPERTKSKVGKINEFTIQRKRSAILYMLSELNNGLVYGRDGDVPETEVQRFVHFLTGDGTREDKINNTTAASAFKKDYRSGAKIEEDDDFIAEYFDKIGLNKLAKKVRGGELSGII